MVVHVPHGSKHVPPRFLNDFAIDDAELATELRVMTDHFTAHLAHATPSLGGTTLVNRVARLVMDPERFRDDRDEPMAAKGMGAVYLLGHDGSPLRKPGFPAHDRERVIDELYVPYHAALEGLVGRLLNAHGACLIVDLHSFPRRALAFEDGSLPRPSICIGFDDFHVDETLRDRWVELLAARRLDVAFNVPFAGSLVPLGYYRRDTRVRSMMIEVRRDLYMDEETGERSARFDDARELVTAMLDVAAKRARELGDARG